MSINVKPKNLDEFQSELQWQLVNLKRTIENFVLDIETRAKEYSARAQLETEENNEEENNNE